MVSVYATDGITKAGMGFLVDRARMLTCAHVLGDAGWLNDPSKPQEAIRVPVLIEGRSEKNYGKILFLSNLGRPGDDDAAVNDVCLLELEAHVAEFVATHHPLLVQSDFLNLSVRTIGVPKPIQSAGTFVTATTKERDLKGRVFLSTGSERDAIAPGFSGAPVIKDDNNGVLGMIVARQKSTSISFMLPLEMIVRQIRERLPDAYFSLRTPSELAHPHVSELREFAAAHLRDMVKTVSAPAHLAFASYERLTEIHRGATVTEEGLSPEKLLEIEGHLRVYVQAPGGAGKTAYLMALMLKAIERGMVPFYLITKNAGKMDESVSAELLFNRCTQKGDYGAFKASARETRYRRILIVDGLNENPEILQSVRNLIDEIARLEAEIDIVAADRLTGGSPPNEFKRATVLPVDLNTIAEPKVARILKRVTNDKFRRLLSIPFFLDLYVALYQAPASARELKGARGRAGMLRVYFDSHLRAFKEGKENPGQVEGYVNALARISYEAYATPKRGLRIPRELLELQLSGPGLVSHLCAAGVLTEEDGEHHMSFRHQLLHDFLVAEHLKSLGMKKWRTRTFDAATFALTSLEPLEITSELLGSQADDFIIEVYDWNYTAALECVLNLEAGSTGEATPVSPGLRDALFALSAEKRFDYFQHTRDKAQRKSAQFSSFEIDYGALSSRESLVEEVVQRFPGTTPVLNRWLDLFRLNRAPEPCDWAMLQDIPLLAWTAANSFRRFASADKSGLIPYLCQLYRSLRSAQVAGDRALSARWRIMHVLGTADDPEAVALLIGAIEDAQEHHWVRYGAVRSLVESASRCKDAASAQRMLEKLRQAMPSLRNISAFNEIRDVAILAESAPTWWAEAYSPVLEEGIRLLQAELQQAAVDRHSGERVLEQVQQWESQLKRL